MLSLVCVFLFFFKQKAVYEMRISDWSSDVCSSDLQLRAKLRLLRDSRRHAGRPGTVASILAAAGRWPLAARARRDRDLRAGPGETHPVVAFRGERQPHHRPPYCRRRPQRRLPQLRSEEHTSELQSLMRISYAVFCLKKKTK